MAMSCQFSRRSRGVHMHVALKQRQTSTLQKAVTFEFFRSSFLNLYISFTRRSHSAGLLLKISGGYRDSPWSAIKVPGAPRQNNGQILRRSHPSS